VKGATPTLPALATSPTQTPSRSQHAPDAPGEEAARSPGQATLATSKDKEGAKAPSYLVCQRCNKKKTIKSGESGENENTLVDLPQHVTLNLHRVQSGGRAEGKGGGRTVTGSSGDARLRGGGSRLGQGSGTGLQPNSVFAQGVSSAASSFVLLGGHQDNAHLNLQSHLNRLNLHSQQQHHSGGGERNLGRESGVADSFVDVGTAGSHLGLGSPGYGKQPLVSQVVQVCTHEHAEKLRAVKELLDSFESGDRKGKGHVDGGEGDDGGQEEKFLCGDCAVLLQDEMERMISECELDCQAYQQALVRLEKSGSCSPGQQPLDEAQFEREMAKCREEEEKEEGKIAELERQLEELEAEKLDLKSQTEDLDRTERDYWRRFNHFNFELDAHLEEKAGLVSKIEGACAQLELLKRTNIYNDVFHIWHDGPFGTINSFRLGKTSKIQVEWDEINAAWGQAVLLLHTMASSCDEFEFSQNRLIPMGSYPKVSDGKSTYDLYGPVTQFLTANYDKAMCIFLQCLQEFAVYAKQYDIAHQTKPPFQLPYKIEGDKICSHTIRLRFNMNDKWTKALKYLLANLKVTLVWLTSSGPIGKQQREERNASHE